MTTSNAILREGFFVYRHMIRKAFAEHGTGGVVRELRKHVDSVEFLYKDRAEFNPIPGARKRLDYIDKVIVLFSANSPEEAMIKIME